MSADASAFVGRSSEIPAARRLHFLIETDDGLVRLRDKDGPVYTNPRLPVRPSDLRDIHLLDDGGLTPRSGSAWGLMKLYERFWERGYHTSIIYHLRGRFRHL